MIMVSFSICCLRCYFSVTSKAKTAAGAALQVLPCYYNFVGFAACFVVCFLLLTNKRVTADAVRRARRQRAQQQHDQGEGRAGVGAAVVSIHLAEGAVPVLDLQPCAHAVQPLLRRDGAPAGRRRVAEPAAV